MKIDSLDARLIVLLTEHPQLAIMECARRLGVARATVTSRLDRLHANGVVAGIVPKLVPEGFGYKVVAFCALQINQELGHEKVARNIAISIPEVLDMFTVTGESDMQLRIAAIGTSELQEVLDRLSRVPGVIRASSSIALQTHFQDRVLPLLRTAATDVRDVVK